MQQEDEMEVRSCASHLSVAGQVHLVVALTCSPLIWHSAEVVVDTA